jgi:hypothetical protein
MVIRFKCFLFLGLYGDGDLDAHAGAELLNDTGML